MANSHKEKPVDRQQKALLLLEIEETAQEEARPIAKVKRYMQACEDVKDALGLVLSHVEMAPKEYKKLDDGVLVLPLMTGNNIKWDSRQELKPDRDLVGIVKAAIELRDIRGKLRSLRQRYATASRE